MEHFNSKYESHPISNLKHVSLTRVGLADKSSLKLSTPTQNGSEGHKHKF